MELLRRTFLAALPTLAVPVSIAEAGTAFFREYERETGGRIGVYARNLVTGRSLSWRAQERFLMCSTFKMSLVACVLARVDLGQEKLDRFVSYDAAALLSYAPVARQNLGQGGMTIAAMCQGAIELSDNTCANLLLVSIGGPPMLTRFWQATGDTVTRLDHNEPMLNFSRPDSKQDTTTPAAMAGNLYRFLLGDVLSPDSRARLVDWMVNCQTGLKLLRAGMPEDWKVADKTGNNGKDAQGDIAVAWPKPAMPILICVYTEGGAPKPGKLQALFPVIGQMVREELA